MKVIVAGSRKGVPDEIVHAALDSFPGTVDEIVSGTARGVDSEGAEYGQMHRIPVREFPADWDRHGKAAGPIRNGEMADYADALILVWDGSSSGSANMRKQMIEKGKPVFEVIVRLIGVIEDREASTRELI